MCQNVKYELSAIPVTMPGSAIGSTSRNEIVSRPKNRNRCTPNDASVPSTSAIAVAYAAAFSESQSAFCMSPLWIAGPNHFVVSAEIGQLSMFDLLNAYRQISAIGTYRKDRKSVV